MQSLDKHRQLLAALHHNTQIQKIRSIWDDKKQTKDPRAEFRHAAASHHGCCKGVSPFFPIPCIQEGSFHVKFTWEVSLRGL
jgi:hypothetical protein